MRLPSERSGRGLGAKRLLCVCASALALLPPWLRAAEVLRVGIVYTSAVEAYGEAATGVTAALRKYSIEPVLLDIKAPEQAASIETALARNNPQAVVVIGSSAFAAIAGSKYTGPVVSTMIMRGDDVHHAEPAHVEVAGQVHLDLPLATLLAELNEVFPRAQRLGIIRNSTRPGTVDTNAIAKARQNGFTIRVLECERAEDLLPAFLSLKNKVDFVLAVPDTTLFNSGTLKALIMASIANRLPIIGFSASFVRSGAAVGLFANYRDVGEQTAEIVQRLLSRSGPRGSDESPRRWVFAVNLRVLRLLGLEHGHTRSAELVVYR